MQQLRLTGLLTYSALLFAALLSVMIFVNGCSSSTDAMQLITVKGSDTMVHLVSEWSEVYMQRNTDQVVAVTGGGSGTGIAALINKNSDIAAASRAMNEDELNLTKLNHVDTQEHIVARDGVVIILHPENPVKQLTMAQIKGLLSGEVKSWKELGGPDKPVLVFSRESSSGTFLYMKDHVLEKQDFVDSARFLPSTAAIIDSVATTPISIGYVGLGYADKAKEKVKIVPVAPNKRYAKAVVPSNETVLSGEYPISRPLYLYSSDKSSKIAQQFVEFTLSEDGQAIVTENGYVAINSKKPEEMASAETQKTKTP